MKKKEEEGENGWRRRIHFYEVIFLFLSLSLSLSLSRQNVYARRRRHRRHFLCACPRVKMRQAPSTLFVPRMQARKGWLGHGRKCFSLTFAP